MAPGGLPAGSAKNGHLAGNRGLLAKISGIEGYQNG